MSQSTEDNSINIVTEEGAGTTGTAVSLCQMIGTIGHNNYQKLFDYKLRPSHSAEESEINRQKFREIRKDFENILESCEDDIKYDSESESELGSESYNSLSDSEFSSDIDEDEFKLIMGECQDSNMITLMEEMARKEKKIHWISLHRWIGTRPTWKA